MAACRILCLAAHPDDLEVYMGATLRLLADAGADLHAAVLTGGERATRQPERGSRIDEQRRAFARLGIEGRFLGLPDGDLDVVDDLAARLAVLAREVRPALVFAPHESDPHRDHATLAGVCGTARWHWLAAPSTYPPTHAVPYADFAPKEELIRCHASQLPGPTESRDHLPEGLDILERAYERDRRLGRLLGVPFAEPLVGPEGSGAPRLVTGFEAFFEGAV